MYTRLPKKKIIVPGLALMAVLALFAACRSDEATAVPPAQDAAAGEAAGVFDTSSLESASPPGDADAVVAAQEMVLNRIYTSALPSVVHIRVTQRVEGGASDQPFRFGEQPSIPQEFFRRGEGSGFVWDEEGHIVTNNHVVAGSASVTVVLADGTEAEATVVGRDPDSDLAVLKADLDSDAFTPVTLGDSDALMVGQLVAAIGNPFGQEFTMTSGIISALGRTISSGTSRFSITEVVQTDAPINPGNSGGPLLDRRGRVIGINTQIISRSGSSSGIGFAVPVNTAKRVVPDLIREGSVQYAWLGISGLTLSGRIAELMDLPEATKGAMVIDITKGGPADEAGLRGSDRTLEEEGLQLPLGGDVIVALNESPVSGVDDVISYLNEHTEPGDRITLTVIRDGGETVVQVTLGSRPRS